MPQYEDYLGGNVERLATIAPAWRVSVYAIVVRERKVLMVRPAWAERWELPGGGVELELEETLIEAAIRECREETGYVLRPDAATLTLLSDGFFSVRSERFYHSLTFTVSGVVDEVPQADWQPNPAEIVDVQWLDASQLQAAPVHHIHRTALNRLGFLDQ